MDEQKGKEMDLSDKLGELNHKLSEAVGKKDLIAANIIRAEIAGLTEEDDDEIDFDGEFARQWYNDCN